MKYRVRNAHRNFPTLYVWLVNAQSVAEIAYTRIRGPLPNLWWRDNGTFIDLYEGNTFTGYWIEVVSE